MKEFVLSRKTPFIYIIRLTGVTVALIVLLNLVIPTFLTQLVLFITSLFVLISAYLPFYFKSIKIVIARDVIIIKKGIFIRREHVLPFKKLVYTVSFATPFASFFGVKAICFKAVRKTVFLPEIDKTQAKKLLSLILEGAENEI